VCWAGALNYEEARSNILNEIERGNRLAVMNRNLFDENTDNSNNNYSNNNNNNDSEKNRIIRNNNNGENSSEVIRINYNPSFQPITFHGWNEESCDRLRAVLESILPINPSHPVLWILYVHLECSFSRFLEGKKVFFRAINAVGFCKNIWILIFRVLRPAFTEKEINDLKNVMIEEKNILFRG
jgi:hypothetical protein